MSQELIDALADAILSLDEPAVATITEVSPKLILNERFVQKDILFVLRGEAGVRLREYLYEVGWFPAGDAFGSAIDLCAQYDDDQSMRWYFARWWEKDALPLSGELSNAFKRALKECVEYSKLSCLSILLFRGVHRMTMALETEPLLHEAIRRGQFDTLTLLLDAGFNPNKTPEGVLLPIEVALAAGEVKHVFTLIQNGAKLYVTSSPPTLKGVGNPFSEFRAGQSWVRSIAQGYPWCHLVLEQSFEEKYELLAHFINSKAHTLSVSPEKRTLAHELVKDKSWADSLEREPSRRATLNATRLEFLRKVLEAGVSPNAMDEAGWTPALQAVLLGDTDALSIMNSYGLNLNSVTEIGTPLILACQRGDAHTASWLIKRGADPAHRDIFNNSAKDYVEGGQDVVLKALFSNLEV
jgi:hypothetical protein